MAKVSATAKTLERLREQGIVCDKAEYWLAYGSVSKDLFGFIDIVALDYKIIAIQATTGSNASARVKKILTERAENAVAWLECGGLIQVWGWRKLSPRGTKREKWEPKIYHIYLEDF